MFMCLCIVFVLYLCPVCSKMTQDKVSSRTGSWAYFTLVFAINSHFRRDESVFALDVASEFVECFLCSLFLLVICTFVLQLLLSVMPLATFGIDLGKAEPANLSIPGHARLYLPYTISPPPQIYRNSYKSSKTLFLECINSKKSIKSKQF